MSASVAGSARSALVTLMTNGTSAGLSLVYGIAAARWFGASGRGHIVAFMYWPTLIAALSMVGIPTATTYYAAHDSESRRPIMGTGLAIMVVTGIVASLSVSLLSPYLIGDADPEVLLAARLYSLSILLTVLVNVSYHPLRVVGHMRKWNTIRLLIDSTPLLALIVMVAVSSRNLVSYATAMLCIQGSVALAALLIVHRATGFSLSRAWVKPLLRYGLPTVLATLPALLNFRVDQAFLVRLVSSSALGNYAAAVSWSQAVLIVTNVVMYMVLPRVAPLRGAVRRAESEHLLRFSVLLMTIVVVPLTIASPFVVPVLFGRQFDQAGVLALLLVPAAGLMGLNSISEELLRSERMLRGPLIAQVTGLLLTAGGVFSMVRWIGIWGAAIVSVVGYVVVTLVLNWFLRQMGMPRAAPLLVPHRRQWRALVEMPRTLLGRSGGPG